MLTSIGGAGAMLLWLKIGTLVGIRRISVADFRWSFVVATLVGGAVLALIAQWLWGVVGRAVARDAGSAVRRFVWGAAATPQVLAVIVLLPLDLLLVGRDTFTATKLTDPLETGWAAMSIALSVSVALWSGYLFYRGIQVAGDLRGAAAAAGVTLGLACAATVIVAVGFGLRLLAGGS